MARDILQSRQRQKHGAQVFVEPTDIPKVGRFAVIADPQGASLQVFKSAHPMVRA